jgi:alginate O-acetyltransferase complex protein AlgI
VLFNSTHYLIFLPIVAWVYFTLPLRPRRLFLLAASYYFYWVFSIPLSLLLVFSTVLDYSAARLIGGSNRLGVRRAALWTSIAGNLLVLGIFKYYNFFNGSLEALIGRPLFPALQLVLPMGISFYTFQTMSYTIDVYRGKLQPCRSLLDVALYVSFFPQLVAGPIMRGTTLMPQFRENHVPNAQRILSGVLLCLWGLFKKVFIADTMMSVVNSVYGTPAHPMLPSQSSGLALLLATYAFAIQIYCDFSAYSDIARGTGRILGFRIMENFRAPYLAVSLTEFWHRWHISLSTWLRDYLYIPLGGNRFGPVRTYGNLMLTMLLGGLWHGANWTFVVWGGLHGLFLALERLLGISRRERASLSFAQKWVHGIITFHLVCLAWVFFRAPDLSYGVEAVARILTFAAGRGIALTPFLFLVVLIAGQIGKFRTVAHRVLLQHPVFSCWAVYGGVAALSLVLSSARVTQFIYFQF